MPIFFLLVFPINLSASTPPPGSVFREYTWLPTMVKETEKFLRVGGKLDYQIAPEHLPKEFHEDGFLLLDQNIDLDLAIRAEVVLELVQSHQGTKGLKIEVNKHLPILIGDLDDLPRPQSEYMLHTYPTVEVPIGYFTNDPQIRFRLTVDSIQAWNWPQNIFYGITFRIYYEDKKLDRARAKIIGIQNGQQIGDSIILAISNIQGVAGVDYLGKYDDFDWEGNGKYFQWHGHPHRGVLRNHIGTGSAGQLEAVWSTDWIPDQTLPMSVIARVSLSDGLMYMTALIPGLILDRNYSVELCKPYHQPENWVTRADTFEAKFGVHGPLQDAIAYQVGWRSWSPCYGRGVFINQAEIWSNEEPCYGYAEHRITRETPFDLLSGENTILTGKTPLIECKMVHGMEVQYPGIMVKVKYRNLKETKIHITEGHYEDRDHFIIHTPTAIYYYDIAGGGFSRMIDPDGKDWIDFRMGPWGKYPDAAAGSFRGIPNFVHGSEDSGAGHPGHEQCTSSLLNDSTILTTTKSGHWQWQCTFTDDLVLIDMLKIDPKHPYWFLYEGVPGGTFAPEQQFFGTDLGGPRFEPLDYFAEEQTFENWHWAYFGRLHTPRILFIGQVMKDRHLDTFGYLGNTEEGIKSQDGMIVFGFGRGRGAKPLLKEKNSFILGFMDLHGEVSQAHQKLAEKIEEIMEE